MRPQHLFLRGVPPDSGQKMMMELVTSYVSSSVPLLLV